MPLPAYPSMIQPITIGRRGAGTDAEGRPNAAAQVAELEGLVVELGAGERPQGDTLGEQTTAQAILPIGTDVRAQDDVTVTYASGITRTYRAVEVHDAVTTLLVDLHRDA